MEATPMLRMRALQHKCYSKPSHIGYLPLSRHLSHLLLTESTNSFETMSQVFKHQKEK